MNKQKPGKGIDWLMHPTLKRNGYTWSPITGCYNDCPYCYARKKAVQFTPRYPLGHDCFQPEDKGLREIRYKGQPFKYGFIPTLHSYRMTDPELVKDPSVIFVCSMSDMFGDWVPDEWIEQVFEACEKAPQHTYLFLTKNHRRYVRLNNIWKLPSRKNNWYGITVVNDEGYFPRCLDTRHNVFVNFEPILSNLNKHQNRENWVLAHWMIFGAETRNGKPIKKTYWRWIKDVVIEAMDRGTPVFMKESLRDYIPAEYFVQQYPEDL